MEARRSPEPVRQPVISSSPSSREEMDASEANIQKWNDELTLGVRDTREGAINPAINPRPSDKDLEGSELLTTKAVLCQWMASITAASKRTSEGQGLGAIESERGRQPLPPVHGRAGT